MTEESQEFFLVVRGGGAGIDSAIFLKKSEKIKYDSFDLIQFIAIWFCFAT